jgi:hypothetical protein
VAGTGTAGSSDDGMADGDMADSGAGAADADGDTGAGAAEPGFEDSAGGGDALPTMDDEQPVAAGRFPAPLPGPMPAEDSGGSEDGSGADAGAGDSAGNRGVPGGNGGAGTAARDGGSSGGDGALTPAEQVAILDAELERGMGEFDRMILEEQRRSARRAGGSGSRGPTQTASGRGAVAGDAEGDYGRDIGGTGGYSTGGGMGGASAGGGRFPQNTAKYPPPPDIPNGNDDDVVARQLREAAMREPDPAVREKLWAEYRKYKGSGNAVSRDSVPRDRPGCGALFRALPLLLPRRPAGTVRLRQPDGQEHQRARAAGPPADRAGGGTAGRRGGDLRPGYRRRGRRRAHLPEVRRAEARYVPESSPRPCRTAAPGVRCAWCPTKTASRI